MHGMCVLVMPANSALTDANVEKTILCFVFCIDGYGGWLVIAFIQTLHVYTHTLVVIDLKIPSTGVCMYLVLILEGLVLSCMVFLNMVTKRCNR